MVWSARCIVVVTVSSVVLSRWLEPITRLYGGIRIALPAGSVCDLGQRLRAEREQVAAEQRGDELVELVPALHDHVPSGSANSSSGTKNQFAWW